MCYNIVYPQYKNHNSIVKLRYIFGIGGNFITLQIASSHVNSLVIIKLIYLISEMLFTYDFEYD